MITLAQIGSPKGLRRMLEVSYNEEDRLHEGGHRGRKSNFAARMRIDRERHRKLILERVHDIYETPEVQRAIAKHVTLRRNLLNRFANRVAIAYEVPPTRDLKGASEDARRRFLDAYKEAETSIRATKWGRYAWICNVVHVLPRIELGRLTWVTVYPHAADVLFDPVGEEKPSILIYASRSRGAELVAVDGEQWWWISGDWELIASEPHGMGPRPWAEFRVSAEPEDDYWDRGRGTSLIESTLELGRLDAHKGWARKIHSKNAAYVLVGESDEVPPEQMLNGETPFFARGDNIRLGTLGLEMSVENFDKEMRSIVEDEAEAYGVPATVVDFEPSSTNDAANVFAFAGPRTHEALVKVRNAQIKHLALAEAKAARSANAEMQRLGHPGAVSDEDIEGFRVAFADLTFADHPKAKVETAEAKMRLGSTDPYEFYAQEHQIPIEQAIEEVNEHVNRRADFLDLLTTRNATTDPKQDTFTLAQLNGQIGGRTAANTNPDGNDDHQQQQHQ